MSDNRQILIYSKYSVHSKRILSLIQEHGLIIDTICIDNQSIRDRVTSDKRLQISVVPTLLSIYNSGVVEKYEGEKAKEYFSQYSQPIMKPLKQTQAEVIPPRVEDNTVSPPSPKDKSATSNLLDLDAKDELFQEPLEEETPSLETRGDEGHGNLPVRKSSKLSATAAAMQKEREQLDSKVPRPIPGAAR